MVHYVIMRKSWVLYLEPALRLVLLAALFLAGVAWWPEIKAFVQANTTDATATIGAFIPPVVLGLVGLGVLDTIWKMLLIRSEALTVTAAGVGYRKGLLPWKRMQLVWRYDQIYETRFGFRPQFWGWVFRCGDLVIVGREGSTREYRIRGLHRPNRAQALIAAQPTGQP